MKETAQRLSEIEEKIRILDATDSDVKNKPGTSYKYRQQEEKAVENLLKDIECPVCMEEMRAEIWCCQNSHPVCAKCLGRLSLCPTCQQKFESKKPTRNRFAEKLISTILKNK